MTATKPDARDSVAAIYEKKRKNGLLDVKFLVKNRGEITHEQARSDFAATLNAIERGNSKALDFGDLNWVEK